MNKQERARISNESAKLGETVGTSVVIQTWVLEQIEDWNVDVVKAMLSSMISQYVKNHGMDLGDFLKSIVEVTMAMNRQNFVEWLKNALEEYEKPMNKREFLDTLRTMLEEFDK